MPSIEEQETIILAGRADDYVSVYTSNTHDLAYFLKHPEFELTEEHRDGITGEVVAADFRIPADRVNYRSILKRKTKPLTEEEREKKAEAFRRNVLGKPSSPDDNSSR